MITEGSRHALTLGSKGQRVEFRVKMGEMRGSARRYDYTFTSLRVSCSATVPPLLNRTNKACIYFGF